MSELKKIYNAWNEEQSDSSKIKGIWAELEKYLCQNCTEEVKEDVLSVFLEISKRIEEEAFYAGYRQSFRLWMEMLSK